MPRRLGVVMDPITSIHPKKDSTLALLLEAQSRGWELRYLELGDLSLRDGVARGRWRELSVRDDPDEWFALGREAEGPLEGGDLELILMRKDPPVDLEYLSATQVLERAERQGALVLNRPEALRNVNEKIAATWFPECAPPSLFTRSSAALRAFAAEHGATVLKPVDAMGGRSIFLLRPDDPNASVILEEMTRFGARYVLAQTFVPDVLETGDKRIILVDGEPVPHAIARLPPPGEVRANLAAGGRAEPCELTDRDRWICGRIGPMLRERGLWLVGIDVIGGFLTEINVTSPTCLREIDRFFGVNVAGTCFDALEARLRPPAPP